MVKQAYGSPSDSTTYNETLGIFDSLLRLLHPFMPFITEELWQHLTERRDGESIMYAQIEQPYRPSSSRSPADGNRQGGSQWPAQRPRREKHTQQGAAYRQHNRLVGQGCRCSGNETRQRLGRQPQRYQRSGCSHIHGRADGNQCAAARLHRRRSRNGQTRKKTSNIIRASKSA